MECSINKQYLALGDRPVLAHTLALFENSSLVTQILVISPQDEIAYCRQEVVERFGCTKVRAIVPGGAERQDSVRNGLLALDVPADEVVLSHDGVRPFLSAPLISAVAAGAGQNRGGCVVGVPVKDTVKEVAAGRIQGTPERSRLWLAQTPQAFRFRVIRDAHEQAARDGYRGTDDASLVERLGLSVAILQGSYRNIKITTPEDLILAEAFLQSPEGG